MASDVMSLFGLDPNTLQQNRTNKAVSQAAAMNPSFAAGAAGGALVGQSINNMFGLQTPEMAQAQSVKDSMSGADLTTVAGLRAAAQKLMMSGDYAQAMALHAEARDMEAASNVAPKVTGFKTYVLGDGSEVQGALVNGVPAMRQNDTWVPLPEDAQAKTNTPKAANITKENIETALLAMTKAGWGDGVIDSGLDRMDLNAAARWVANRTKQLEAEGMVANLAEVQAMGEAESMIVTNDDLIGTSKTFAPTEVEPVTPVATPTGLPNGYEVVIHNGKRYGRHATDQTQPIIEL
jgi:hypothetical protein